MPIEGSFNLVTMLSAQVRAHPTDVAVADDRTEITVSELDRRSAQVGAHLRRRGIAADNLVGLSAEPSVDLVTGAWGIIRSGGAYLPMAASYPDDRLAFMLADSRARVILCPARMQTRAAELAPPGAHVVTVEEALTPDPAFTDGEFRRRAMGNSGACLRQ